MCSLHLALLTLLVSYAAAGSQAAWTISKSGDIILHGVFPLRRRFVSAITPSDDRSISSGLNYEGLVWLGAMVERISQINEATGFLPGNLTIGYDIRDTCCHPDIGLKQVLSGINQIINDEHNKPFLMKKDFHVPTLIGPACDKVEDSSSELLEILHIPRISYTTTSFRFNNKAGNVIRTVPSDLVHVEALLKVLSDMGWPKVSILHSMEESWWERAKVFERIMKKRRLPLVNIIHTTTIYDPTNIRYLLRGSQVIVVFGGAKPTRMLIQKEKVQGVIWISVGKFDSPLLKVFDENGKLLNKTIIRNIGRDDFKEYREKLGKKLTQKKDHNSRMEWLDVVWDKYSKECRGRNRTVGRECSYEVFERKIEAFIKEKGKNSHSTLTIQGIFDAVDLVVNSVRDVLSRECVGKEPIPCLSRNKWSFDNLRETELRRHGEVSRLNKHGTLTGSYSIQVLRRTRVVLGRRMMAQKGWTFEKMREWNITEDLSYLNNAGQTKTVVTNYTTHTPVLLESSVGRNSSQSCSDCGDNTSESTSCQSSVALVHWTNSWAIALYLLQFLILCAVLATLIYFIKHKDSPIMILCCSWPDNLLVVLLCLFTCLPAMHIGQLSFVRCLFLWPAVNIIFGLYVAILLSKTLFVQNVLKCEVATDHPLRRMLFSLAFVVLHLVILITPSALGFVTATKTACSSRGLVVFCDIENSTGVLLSMALNCVLVLMLLVLSIQETLRQRRNFCRTENLIGVATVAMVTYFGSIIIAYFNLVLGHHLVVTLVNCLLLLSNPVVCLILIYVPTMRLVSTWLRQHTRQEVALTSIKRAQAMQSAANRQSATVPDSIFNMNFSPDLSLLPSPQSAGYYFDMRAPSPNPTYNSYPASLVRSVHEPTHVVFGYGRPGIFAEQGTMSGDESAGVQTSMEELETMSRDSYYDNVLPRHNRHFPAKPDIFREITNYCKSDNDVFVNKQCEDDTELAAEETDKWPAFEGLRASNI